MAQQQGRRRSSAGRRGGNASSGRDRRTRRAPLDHQEVEWQFDAADLDAVGAWLSQHSSGSGLVIEPESDEEVRDTYYDAEDWRFYRAGYALRVRKAGGDSEATMKSISRAEGNVRRRREITEPLTDDRPATLGKAKGPVGERSRSLLGGREMRRMFEVRTRRRTFALVLEDLSPESANGAEDAAAGKRVRIGEVVLDEAEIPFGEDGESHGLSRVEVESGVGTAPTPDLRGFVDEMQYALDLEPAALSKFEAGLYATGLSPRADTDTGPTQIGPDMPLGEVAFAVLRRQFARMRAHEPGTRIGEDPEELHDMRVATRRMRAAMKIFEDALPERARWFREELRWVAGALGDVRDLDVQIEDLQGRREQADGREAELLGKVIDVLRKLREKARGRMLGALDSDRYERLEKSFAEMLERGPDAERELARTDGRRPYREPVTAAAPALISARYRKWSKAAKKLDETSQPEAFHDLRKKGKKLRYALEFVSEVYDDATRGVIKPLKTLQDDLGDHQDAVVAAETLRELGTTTDGPRVSRGAAFTMGVYAERYGREAEALRSRVLAAGPLRSLDGDWKDLEKAMKKAAR